jgi:hypothetical protein
MKKLFLIIVIIVLTIPVFAQQNAQMENTINNTEASKVYYGGIIGLSFGNYFRINIAPMIGYKFVPKASVGMKAAYEYINDSRNKWDIIYHNYGASIFTRYHVIPQAYVHAEFAYMSYQYKIEDTNFESDRYWVPFILLGGGYIQRISPSTAIVAEILFDVLQDSQSPYEEWSPFISIGVNVGF